MIDRIVHLDNLFNDFVIKNTDQLLEELIINDCTFVKTPEWLTPKRCVLNPNNEDNKCFQYSITLFLHHEQIGRNYCRISKIKPFINNLTGKISAFHHKNKIIKLLK